MRALVIGEGRHDVGSRDPDASEGRDGAPGWSQAILELLRDTAIPLTRTHVPFARMLPLPSNSRKFQPYPKGPAFNALRAKVYADLNKVDFDILIFITDADTPDNREWHDVYAAIEEAMTRVGSPMPHVVCVPKSMSESWLLADSEAWRRAGLEDLGQLPKDPEECWGDDHRPDTSDRPKHLFNRLGKQAHDLCGSGTERRYRIAATSDPRMLLEKCPLSFRAFWKRLHDVGIAIPPPDDPMRRR
ncbi:DUF4276 family protein [Skermanella pratensis]|uniref:DUF4276 family protein n=1 Tax=Skermanella pratensis TaxID=2233999 RepID=UPI0013017CE9|nr:DUF4276 family protein [Skermanella pratensis]